MKKVVMIAIILASVSCVLSYSKYRNNNTNNEQLIVYNDDDQIIQPSMDFLLKTEGLSFEAYEGMGHNELAICYGNSFKEYLNLFHKNCTQHYDILKKCIITKNEKYCQHLSNDCQDIGATEKECNTMLSSKIVWILNDLKSENLELNNKQYEALISLVYNLKNNFNAFINSNLYQYLKSWSVYQKDGYNIDDFSMYTFNIINEWLDFSRVQGEITCSIVERRVKEVITFYNNHSIEEKEIAYSTLNNILQETYSGCKFIQKYKD